jgi:hypothetical protein
VLFGFHKYASLYRSTDGRPFGWCNGFLAQPGADRMAVISVSNTAVHRTNWVTTVGFWCGPLTAGAILCIISEFYQMTRGGAAAARVAHNHEVAGSSPAPATISTLTPNSEGSFILQKYCKNATI